MKTLLLLLSLFFTSIYFQDTELEKLTTKVYEWDKLVVEKTSSGERRQIFEGQTNVLEYLEAHVTTLNPGQAPHGSHVHVDMEELIIVKEGLIEQSINGEKRELGPGSVIVAVPGDDHGIRNAGNTPATYYIIRWKTGEIPDLSRKRKCGGSDFYDWNKIGFVTTEKGGRRQFMNRQTALLENLEMHVTTLNEGVTSHGEHIHSNEEIILMIRGEAEESINGVAHRMTPGSLVLLTDGIPHGIRNVGKGQCEYFAFKWVN